MNGLKIAVVGATGAVGQELLSILDQRKFPVGELRLFASARSEGKSIQFQGKTYRCEALKKGCFEGTQIAFFDASDAISKEWVPQAADAGAWVVDNSATYRMEPKSLLIVPEVNGDLLATRLSKSAQDLTPSERVISGPNCSVAGLVVALKPILDRWGIKRIVVSTYQSTSGAGKAATEELVAQLSAIVNKTSPVTPKSFTHQIAFNCIPHIGGFKDDGYTGEEQKIIAETQKLLGKPGLRVSATAIRVPTLSAHGESVNIECEKAVEPAQVREVLRSAPGVVVLDEPTKNVYPMSVTGQGDPVEGASGRDAVYVGRIRKDPSIDHGINLWLVSDNLRKGAALNAVQIGEMLVKTLR